MSVSVARIIRDICAQVGLGPEDIDVSDLEGVFITGYQVPRVMTARAAIEPLRQVAFFDVVQSGDTLRFVKRGGPIALELAETDLGARESESAAPVLVQTRMVQDVDLPYRIRVHYRSTDRDGEPGQQESPTRYGTRAVNEVDVDLGVDISDEQAVQIAEVLFRDAWASRFVHTFALDQSMRRVEPADVLSIPVDGRVRRIRVGPIDDRLPDLRNVTAYRDDDGNYVSTAVAEVPSRPPAVIRIYRDTELVLLDLPALLDSHDDAGFYAATRPTGTGNAWRGASIKRSTDGGTTFSEIATGTGHATIGSLVDPVPLPDNDTSGFDEVNVITIDLPADVELESRTEGALLNEGANALAIGAHERWLIVQFRDAEEISPGRWELSGLLQGRRGTEYLIGTTQVDDTVVLISGPGIVRLSLQISQIGVTHDYRATSYGKSGDSGEEQSFAGNGQALVPFSPVDIEADAETDQDIVITWTRRNRIGPELAANVVTEQSLAYEVDIMADESGDVVLRTLGTDQESITYSMSDQVDDFGTSPPWPLRVRVYQISATVGRGIAGEAILA